MPVNSSTLIETNQRVPDLQFSQIMVWLSDISIWHPTKVYEYHNSFRRRLHTAAVRLLTNSFWRSPKLRHWSSTGESAISVITGNFHSRFVLRDLCVDITEQLHTAKVPVLLALRVPQEKDTSANVSSNDPLKYLIRQAIRVHHELQTEKSMALGCATFHEATSESEWFQVLEGILADINSPVYILIDLDILDRSFSPIGGFSWVQAFKQSFNALEARGLATKVKVLFISYGSLPFRLSAMEHSQFVVSAKTQLITARQRTVGRGVTCHNYPSDSRTYWGALLPEEVLENVLGA